MKQVVTKYGKLEGLEKDGYSTFLGVPYAKAPVGALRWKAPQAPECWDGVRDATSFGHRAWQMQKLYVESEDHSPPMPFVNYGREFYADPAFVPPMDEDCLYLNIWTPAETGTEKLPVAFWIHGGAFMNGYGSEIEFDGEAFAKKGVILVTINYRLGALGFLCHPALIDENGRCGNYGILDQIAALQWVRENIAAFGGDPEHITIFGQSAGAMSVQTLICSPLTKGMFCGAILQSGGGFNAGFSRDVPMERAMQTGESFAEAAGAKTAEKLRALSPEQIMQTCNAVQKENMKRGIFGLSFEPVIDGHLLVKGYRDYLAEGLHPDVPYMLGSCLNDMMVQPGTDGRNSSIYCGCVNWSLINQLHGRKPAYIYQFCRQLPGDNQGAFHSSELWYVFRTLGRCWRPMTDADMRLADQICDYWCNFVKSGDPNGDGLPNWAPCCWEDHNVQMLDIEHE